MGAGGVGAAMAAGTMGLPPASIDTHVHVGAYGRIKPEILPGEKIYTHLAMCSNLRKSLSTIFFLQTGLMLNELQYSTIIDPMKCQGRAWTFLQ